MKSIRILTAAFLVLSVTACTARYIRQAQDEFSRAAHLENEALVRGYDIDIKNLAEDPVAAYRISLSLLNRELDKNENALRQDKLYGTALMLKAMCLWRLASVPDKPISSHLEMVAKAQKEVNGAQSADERARAEEDLEKAEQELTAAGGELITVIQETKAEYKAGQIVLGERDLAMLNALPGLRDHDLALKAETYENAERFFKSALEVVNKTAEDSKLVSPGSQMDIYLRLAMLSTCRAWRFTAYSFHANDSSMAKEKSKEPQRRAKELFEKLEPLAEADKGLDKTIKLMKARMGL